MQVCVVALGKIGLPLAVQISNQGHSVVGADIDDRVVDAINSGVPPFDEPGLADGLADGVAAGRITATTDTADAVSRSDAVIVVVPLVVDDADQPDFRAMDAATDAIGRGLQRGTLVSYETTLPIHTARRRFVPALESATGLTCGVDFFVCHSPERVSSGTVFRDLRLYPKLVGGVDEASGRRAVDFYEAILTFDQRDDLPRPNGVWDLGSAEAAEFAKLAETTYRDVNIGLANEFARYADSLGVDIAQVIAASNSQPFSHIHSPGIAVGGHCIPVYPRLYLSTDPDATIPRTARAANSAMPTYAIDRLESAVGDRLGGSFADATVGIWGVAYRGGVKEDAFSGAYPLREELTKRGARVLTHDPMYSDDELDSMGFVPWNGTDPLDAVIIQTNHDEFMTLGPADLPGVKGILDGRNCLDRTPWVGTDVVVLGLGDGSG